MEIDTFEYLIQQIINRDNPLTNNFLTPEKVDHPEKVEILIVHPNKLIPNIIHLYLICLF